MNYILVMTIVLVGLTVIVGIRSIKNGLSGKKATVFLGMNGFTFITLMIVATVFAFSGYDVVASSHDGAAVGEAVAASSEGLKYIAAALSTGLACIGCGIAVAISGSAAIGAISENEKLLGKTIIFVGLAEGIAIYGLIISIMILGN